MQSIDVALAPSEPRRVVPHSKRLWNLDWRQVLPWTFEDVSVELGDFDAALPFIQEHYARIFGADQNQGRFLASPLTEAKRRFCNESDVFLFRAGDRTVGLVMSHPSDWSTYYMRTAAIVPEYRGKNLLSRFLARVYAPLEAAGVERIEVDVSSANAPVIQINLRQGFQITSTEVSERWGLFVRMTRFLSDEAGAVFQRQFCNGAPPKPTQEHQSTTPTIERRTS